MALGLLALASYGLKRVYRVSVYTLLNLSTAPFYHSHLAEGYTYFHLKSAANGNVMIYDSVGTPIWCIEPPRALCSIWNVYTVEQHLLVAKIHLGRTTRFVQFNNNPEIKRAHFCRDWRCGMMFNCQFALQDGTSFVWTKQTQFLEEIWRGSDGHELRRRVARANRLRPWVFDWEIAVSSEVSPLIALVTAFIPMQSQWDQLGSQATTGISLRETQFEASSGCLLPLSDDPDTSLGYWDKNWTRSKFVHRDDSTDLGFFNPPQFAKL